MGAILEGDAFDGNARCDDRALHRPGLEHLVLEPVP